MQNLDSQTIQLAIVAAVALTMLLQTIFLLAILVKLSKAARSMREDIEDLRSSVVPVIDNVKELLAKTAPKIENAAVDLAAVSHNLRRQTADIQSAAEKVIDRVLSQTARMDSMLTNTFDAVDRAAGFMSDTVSKPMRQLSGILASAKAVVESLRSGVPETLPPGDQARGDKDMFV